MNLAHDGHNVVPEKEGGGPRTVTGALDALLQSAPVSRCRGAKIAQNKPYMMSATAANPTISGPMANSVTSRNVRQTLRVRRTVKDSGSGHEPADQDHHDAPSDPPDTAKATIDSRLIGPTPRGSRSLWKLARTPVTTK